MRFLSWQGKCNIWSYVHAYETNPISPTNFVCEGTIRFAAVPCLNPLMFKWQNYFHWILSHIIWDFPGKAMYFGNEWCKPDVIPGICDTYMFSKMCHTNVKWWWSHCTAANPISNLLNIQKYTEYNQAKGGYKKTSLRYLIFYLHYIWNWGRKKV